MKNSTTTKEDAMTLCPLCKRPDFGPHLCRRTARVTPLRGRGPYCGKQYAHGLVERFCDRKAGHAGPCNGHMSIPTNEED